MSKVLCSCHGERSARPLDAAARFWSRVRRGDGDGCWEWKGATTKKRSHTSGGYGIVTWTIPGYHTMVHRAHRIAWLLTHGKVPAGMCVCHRCDNRLCVRPDHLFLGTAAENMADAARKGRMRRLDRQAVLQAITEAAGNKSEAARRLGIARSTVIKIAFEAEEGRSTTGPATMSSFRSATEVRTGSDRRP